MAGPHILAQLLLLCEHGLLLWGLRSFKLGRCRIRHLTNVRGHVLDLYELENPRFFKDYSGKEHALRCRRAFRSQLNNQVIEILQIFIAPFF